MISRIFAVFLTLVGFMLLVASIYAVGFLKL